MIETDIFCAVTVANAELDCLGRAEDELEHVRSMIRMFEDELLAMAVMTEPLKMIRPAIEYEGAENEEVDMVGIIRGKVSQRLEMLGEYRKKEDRLELLLDNWDKCHDAKGEPIGLPESMKWDDAYIEIF